MKKIVIAMDSFKGCLTSAEANEAVAEGIRAVFPNCETVALPIADGGEGMMEVLTNAAQGRYVTVRAHNPLMQLHNAVYGISGDGHTAFIEMAAISGLPLVPPSHRNPLYTTSYGTGELVYDALERGCKHIILGLGGSATNDGALGMLQALGMRFFDAEDHELGTDSKGPRMCGVLLQKLCRIDSSTMHPMLSKTKFTVICDVNNPFYGPDGAACVFAPQKGAKEEEVKMLDDGLKHLAKVIIATTGKNISMLPGAGAAGGMGGGLYAWLDATLKPGIEVMLSAIGFTEKTKGADFIITGEGQSDRQSMMGKVPSGILKAAMKQKVPVLLIAGSVRDVAMLNKCGFESVFSITPSPLSLEEAMKPKVASDNLKRAAEQICRLIRCCKP